MSEDAARSFSPKTRRFVAPAAARTVVLLGPQRGRSDAARVLAELGVRDRVALCTAGWQERETEDAGLVGSLGVACVNLDLHRRSEEVFAADPELAAAYSKRQELLRHLQNIYRLRLEYDVEAARAISVRHVEPELLEEEARFSVDRLRRMDYDHLQRCSAIHRAFEERWKIAERPSMARHREELRALVEPAAALVIAGGHVASLLNRLKLFDALGLAAGKPVIAWSAGAMVLTERIVLFHDSPPYGETISQVLDAGFGLVTGVVVLPDPQHRIDTEDRAGIRRFAQRMAPAACLALDVGSEAVFAGGQLVRASVDRLTTDGDYQRKWVA